MGLKRILVLVALMIAVSQTAAVAQETGPLVMRIEFEWAVVGVVGGGLIGAMAWLTDPASPGNNLADSVVSGAAWGALFGAGFGIFVLQRAIVLPQGVAVNDPLAPRNRISADPVGAQSGETYLLAQRDAAAPSPGEIRLPLLRLRF